MDRLTPAERSRLMAKIRGRDTQPELLVRSLVHGLGFRFRLQAKDLPGRPDLVLPRHRAAIFVHGCFWHAHRCKVGRKKPGTNVDFWLEKFERNKARDRRVVAALRRRGWRVLVVWECQLGDAAGAAARIDRWLRGLAPLAAGEVRASRARSALGQRRQAEPKASPVAPRRSTSRRAKHPAGVRAGGRSRSSR